MANPWTKKNPVMSLWLSGANALASRGRGAAAQAVARQQTLAVNQAMRFWTGAWLAAAKPKKRRR